MVLNVNVPKWVEAEKSECDSTIFLMWFTCWIYESIYEGSTIQCVCVCAVLCEKRVDLHDNQQYVCHCYVWTSNWSGQLYSLSTTNEADLLELLYTTSDVV